MFAAILTAVMSEAHRVTAVALQERLPFTGSSAASSRWPAVLSSAQVHRHEDLLCLWNRAARVMIEGSCSLAEARQLALTSIRSQHEYAAQTVRKMTGTIDRFFLYVERAHGVSSIDGLSAEIVEDFIWAPQVSGHRIVDVSPKTARNRRSFLRSAFADLRALGVPVADELVGPSIDFDRSAVSRMLTDAEMDRVRSFAGGSLFISRRPLLVALSEAGGSAPDIAGVTFDDIDLEAGTIEFHGGFARVNPLSSWGIDAIEAWALNVPTIPDGRLCAADHLPEGRAAQSITTALTRLLTDAGFGRVTDVSPKSIRLTCARKVLDRDGIIAAARFLGSESLDSTAGALRFDWRQGR